MADSQPPQSSPRLTGPSFIVQTNTLRPFGSFALVSTSKPLRQASWIPPFLRRSLVSSLQISYGSYGRSYPWAIGKGPIMSIVDSPFRPMLNILARMIFQLIPVACPNHVASGEVYTLLKILQEATVNGNLILFDQDLAGFFASIDQARFLGVWYMLLDFLRHMDVWARHSTPSMPRNRSLNRSKAGYQPGPR